jgi:hypothetical protein
MTVERDFTYIGQKGNKTIAAPANGITGAILGYLDNLQPPLTCLRQHLDMSMAGWLKARIQ